MKVQVLADFIIECTWSTDEPKKPSIECPNELPDLAATWILHMDRASDSLGSGARLVLTNSDGVVTKYTLQFKFKATDNQAKYEALLGDLKLAKQLEIGQLKVFTNSQLVDGQVTDEYEARDLTMTKYLNKVRTLMSALKYFSIFNIPQCENAQANTFSQLGTSMDNTLN